MSSMPATTLATADKMELRMVTQRSTIGASSSSSAASPVVTSHKPLADVTSTFNEKRPSPKNGTAFASKDDVLVRTTAPLAFFAPAP